ncbi:MAG: D-alanyl-D-alanine carboxypeptidase family protein [Nitrospira sp.]|nr:D-alanyl-D-alanine carboxypeptidase family protein [bacterium]MBL7049264.1 D-alanyl-D-alanine carboxypeptidase family protein [Nitrospira sp.]
MNRRDFLRISALTLLSSAISPEAFASRFSPEDYDDYIRDFLLPLEVASSLQGQDLTKNKDYIQKMRNFNAPHKNDLILSDNDLQTFQATLHRIRKVQKIMGNGHFQKVGLDQAIRAGNNYSKIGSFTKKELEFMEKIFYRDAREYGFYGSKPIKNITENISEKDIIKVPYTGNYLYKGIPVRTYDQIKDKLGPDVILTSGVRGVIKQFYLFLNKTRRSDGNLSLASRALAPPGYSFHGNGDFDVGKKGFGVSNFTERFTTTEVYKRLCDLGYLKLRYPENNMLGVRFEPWHIKTRES